MNSTDSPARILLDCDPGIDDAMAIALALGSSSAELVGITTVAGNVPQSVTTANALRLTEFYGAAHVPVIAGAIHPLTRPNVFAANVHGTDGLGGAPVPAATRSLQPGFGPDYLIEQLRAHPREITLVATGPMTNIALALRKEPQIVEWVREIVLMGGSYIRGNVTAAAEFNFYADPEAAAAVFEASWKPVMIGLDVTLTACVNAEVLDRWRGFGALSDQLIVPSSANYFDSAPGDEQSGPAIHDACAIGYVLHPELFTVVSAHTRVETHGQLTSGMSVVDFVSPDKNPAQSAPANSLVAIALEVPAFWDVMSAAFADVAERMSPEASV